jgi:hypothetical protein
MSSGQRSGQCAITQRSASRTSIVSTLPLPEPAEAARRMWSDRTMMIRWWRDKGDQWKSGDFTRASASGAMTSASGAQ